MRVRTGAGFRPSHYQKDLARLAGAAAEGMYVMTYGIPNDRLPPQGKEFLTSVAAGCGGDRGPDLALATALKQPTSCSMRSRVRTEHEHP